MDIPYSVFKGATKGTSNNCANLIKMICFMIQKMLLEACIYRHVHIWTNLGVNRHAILNTIISGLVCMASMQRFHHACTLLVMNYRGFGTI